MNRVFSTTNAMFVLWERARENLTKKDIEWFAGAHDLATSHITHLKTTVEGIGCLVLSDTHAGNFQSTSDVPSLLFSIANALDGIEAITLLAALVDREK